MSAGPTTRAFVDKDNNPVNGIGGQNANGDYVVGHTAHDIAGVPIAVALDSSVQSLIAGMSTSNTALASIQAGTAALVTASATEITLLGEIFTVAGTLATAAGQGAGNASLATIATNTSGAATDAHLSTLITDVVAGLAPLATDAHLVAQTTAIGVGNTALAAILAKQPTSPALDATVAAITAKLNAGVAITGTVLSAGTSGADFSANRPTLPNVGAAFAASGPYASYVLVATVPANANRANIDIENTSGAQIAVIRDDGTAASAAPPANASVFALAGGAAAGQQGGSWTSATFKGRLQIYALSAAAQVAVMVE